MAARRAFLAGIACVCTAGCVDGGGSGGGDGGTKTPATDAEPEETPTADPSYFLTAVPIGVDDGLESVLSTDDEAVSAIEPLVRVVVEVAETFEIAHASITPAEAEAFEELTADVERYFGGNPPGYYIDHEGRRVSVTLGGG